ncbi:hypothetical protein K438DRAFT_1764062 [Mycena galopus ATCC 62051]|nr:hypothetical protein K438DRAFT_1764062 [Mycena galopus ATCC 62051]
MTSRIGSSVAQHTLEFSIQVAWGCSCQSILAPGPGTSENGSLEKIWARWLGWREFLNRTAFRKLAQIDDISEQALCLGRAETVTVTIPEFRFQITVTICVTELWFPSKMRDASKTAENCRKNPIKWQLFYNLSEAKKPPKISSMVCLNISSTSLHWFPVSIPRHAQSQWVSVREQAVAVRQRGKVSALQKFTQYNMLFAKPDDYQRLISHRVLRNIRCARVALSWPVTR